jgi:RNA polymerase sigma factor for flagellar operon FliA
MSPEEQFLEQLSLIERVVASICRRNSCFGDDADEFDSWVKERMIETEYKVFRQFSGKSSLKTYLTVVIHNLFRDFRIKQWGKWRPSAKAKRMGKVAVQLECLLSRDGHSFAEATAILRERFEVEENDSELESLVGELPVRIKRRFESVEQIENIGTIDGVERRVEDSEKRSILASTETALESALATLDAEDRLVLKMRYQDGFTIAQIAGALHLEARPLYSRFEKCLKGLRRNLEESGVTSASITDILGWERSDIQIDYGVEASGNSESESVQSGGEQ